MIIGKKLDIDMVTNLYGETSEKKLDTDEGDRMKYTATDGWRSVFSSLFGILSSLCSFYFIIFYTFDAIEN